MNVGRVFSQSLRTVQRTKAQTFQDNLRKARGKASPDARDMLQQKIEDLSALLGVEPVVLASAIAGVVKPKIPAASSSSISSAARSSGSSVLSAFAEGLNQPPPVAPTAVPTETTTEGGMVASILSAVKEAGFDDMGIETD
jgi:hypothetical protein